MEDVILRTYVTYIHRLVPLIDSLLHTYTRTYTFQYTYVRILSDVVYV